MDTTPAEKEPPCREVKFKVLGLGPVTSSANKLLVKQTLASLNFWSKNCIRLDKLDRGRDF